MANAEAGLNEILGGASKLEGEEALRSAPVQGEELLSDEGGGEASGGGEATGPATETKSTADDKKKSATAAQPTNEDDEPAGSDPHPVPRKALIEERKKRQEAERIALEKDRRLAELEGQLSVYSKQGQTQPAQTKQEPKTEDELGEFLANPTAFFSKLTEAQNQTVQQLRTEMQQAVGKQRLALSVEIMRSQHPDFDEATSAFEEVAKSDPSILAQFRASPHPAKFAYEYGKLRKQLEDVGSIDELKTKLREEVRKELAEESQKQSAQTAAARISTSSAGARSAGTAPVSVGDIPLSDILATG